MGSAYEWTYFPERIFEKSLGKKKNLLEKQHCRRVVFREYIDKYID